MTEVYTFNGDEEISLELEEIAQEKLGVSLVDIVQSEEPEWKAKKFVDLAVISAHTMNREEYYDSILSLRMSLDDCYHPIKEEIEKLDHSEVPEYAEGVLYSQ